MVDDGEGDLITCNALFNTYKALSDPRLCPAPERSEEVDATPRQQSDDYEKSRRL